MAMLGDNVERKQMKVCKHPAVMSVIKKIRLEIKKEGRVEHGLRVPKHIMEKLHRECIRRWMTCCFHDLSSTVLSIVMESIIL